MTGSVVNLAPYGGRGRGKAPHRPGGARGNSSGSLLVELSCGSLLVMLFVLVSIHLGPAIFAAYANDHACRDACRNASQARDAAEAQKLVQVILKDYQSQGFLSSPTVSSPIVYQDFGGTPPAQTSPYVKVTTSTTMTMPFGVLSFFNSGPLQDGKVSFTKSYTFPIVRVK
ncbi:MAG: hypothetical protein IPP97_08495 [Candidatus Obscuribacter sp.]|nr:hypothetical protein [Candidatus Obscuribacter sp.]MBP6351239.1 hypothetical protein [Candidatus Obscuribacter sp.]MBP6592458.1 hypothetical protein [Candidatus Obscuribacter sp.]MBP7575889.1 hypothetical protein [Candidatus Obscuribacter sp.]